MSLGGISNLDYTILLCTRMPETVAFYRDVMQFPIETEMKDWVSFRVGASLLTLRPRANCSVCDDGDACTFDDTCGGGSCGGAELPCDDGNACNGVEVCGAGFQCVAGTPVTCEDDGNACNGLELCNTFTGVCEQLPPNCDDNNPCTADSCDAQQGVLLQHNAVDAPSRT